MALLFAHFNFKLQTAYFILLTSAAAVIWQIGSSKQICLYQHWKEATRSIPSMRILKQSYIFMSLCETLTLLNVYNIMKRLGIVSEIYIESTTFKIMSSPRFVL